MAFPATPTEEMMTTPLIKQPTTKGQAICPYCGVGCRLWMESAGGELIRVKGVADAPANLGGICAKGATLPEVIHKKSCRFILILGI